MMMFTLRLLAYGAAIGSLFVAPHLACAQPADGLLGVDPDSDNENEVAPAGIEGPTHPIDSKDITMLKVAAGGLAASGNARSVAVTASSRMRLRRDASQASLGAALHVSRQAAGPDEPMRTTMENFMVEAQYDHFMGGGLVAFFAMSARRHRFQGLSLRLNWDPGIAYYLIDQKEQQLWGEVGYDLQYDIRHEDVLEEAAADGVTLDKRDWRHSARLFAGYHVTLNQAVTVGTGIEYLQGVRETEYWHLNWDGEIHAALVGPLSAATSASVRYENHPLPGIERTDIVTTVSLVVQLL